MAKAKSRYNDRTRYSIGRHFDLGPMYFSFDLVWKDGKINIENEDKSLGPSTAEKEVIYRHLQSPQTGINGWPVDGGDAERFEEVLPGTVTHFRLAAHLMPAPFGRVPV